MQPPSNCRGTPAGPELLLIDDVISVGDLAFQRKRLDHAKKMLSEDATLLFVSHNMLAIEAICHVS